MQMPTLPRVWVGASLLCVGIVLFPAYKHWFATRTWTAVDVPISLAPGHLKADNFYVNLSTVYHIEIELNGYEYWRDPHCQTGDVIQARWWLSREGQVISTWRDYWRELRNVAIDDPVQGAYLGRFESHTGRYSLDVEMISDANCLQSFHPRLQVYAVASDYGRGGWINESLLLVSFALAGIGAAFLVVSSVAPVPAKIAPGQSLAIFQELCAERQLTARKSWLMGSASSLPAIGYIYAQIWFILFLAIATVMLGRIYWSSGIAARLLNPSEIQASTGQRIAGLLVYVGQNGLYLNSQRVTAEELPHSLESEFARRADWSVYVEADSHVDFQAVVSAMELVRRARGTVILLTPKMRAEAEANRR